MLRTISYKTVCYDINEDLLAPVYGRLFHHGVSPLWCIWSTFVVLCRDAQTFLVRGL